MQKSVKKTFFDTLLKYKVGVVSQKGAYLTISQNLWNMVSLALAITHNTDDYS